MVNRTIAPLLAALLAPWCAVPLRADVVVYDSYTASTQPFEIINDTWTTYEPDSRLEVSGGIEHDAQTGDIVTLAGTARHVTQFSTRFYKADGATSKTLTATLTLYSVLNGLPDQVLWSGQQTGHFVGSNGQTLEIPFAPGIDVPDTFAFGIAIDFFENFSGPYHLGPLTSGGTTIGSSPPRVLLQDSTTLAWYQEDPAIKNLQARVWAVPGPSGAALFGLLGVTGMRARRR